MLHTKFRETLGGKTSAEAINKYLNSAYGLVLRRPLEFAHYTNQRFQSELLKHGKMQSMSRRGQCLTATRMGVGAC